jgi:RNA polymerase sigma-70 factor (ECF subfamily)
MTREPAPATQGSGRQHAVALRSGCGCRIGRKPAPHGLRSVFPTPGTSPHHGPQLVLHQPGCRPGGCAGLCTDEILAVIYRANRGPLLRQARAILGDSGLAEEVVQETFVRAWRACSAFDPDGSPMFVWLSVILRNLALDRMRSRGRRPGVARSVPDNEALGPSQPDGVDLLLLRTRLRDALARLHDDHRTAVLETVMRDRPYDEVAAELGIPVGTVKSRTHYALRRMRRILEAENGPGPGLLL